MEQVGQYRSESTSFLFLEKDTKDFITAEIRKLKYRLFRASLITFFFLKGNWKIIFDSFFVECYVNRIMTDTFFSILFLLPL
jgi:hypothetical protein